jgi:hypothetical protein
VGTVQLLNFMSSSTVYFIIVIHTSMKKGFVVEIMGTIKRITAHIGRFGEFRFENIFYVSYEYQWFKFSTLSVHSS